MFASKCINPPRLNNGHWKEQHSSWEEASNEETSSSEEASSLEENYSSEEASLYFSAAKAAQGMQMSLNLSVRPSVNNAYLFVQFTSIFYNSKSDQMKLRLLINQMNKIIKEL